jgi:uncharacterized protein (DUF427 family)
MLRVSLTVGNGPFGKQPTGRFNFDVEPPPGRLLLWDPVPYRVRAVFARRTVVDSTNVKLLYETGYLPVWYFPDDDLRADLLEPTAKSTHCPYKGDASYRSIRVGDRVAEDAVWSYPQPLESAPFLAGHAAVVWDAADEWFVEDAQAFGHPRDPYHRIDVYPTARHVRVSFDGELLAESTRALMLVEAALPPRFYLPPQDVRMELLVRSPTKTRCAYKGSASYWHVRAGDRLEEDLVWTYKEPQHDALPVRDLLCFYNERVDLELDGERLERPRTQWSRE